MSGVRATVGGGQSEAFPLSFDDILGRVPGRGRGDAKKGMYQNRNGAILVVYSVNPQFVTIERRANGKRTNRTGFTRTGMFIVEKSGKARLVTCTDAPDGNKNWKAFTESITLAGNPHVVPNPIVGTAQAEGGFDDDEEFSDEDDS